MTGVDWICAFIKTQVDDKDNRQHMGCMNRH